MRTIKTTNGVPIVLDGDLWRGSSRDKARKSYKRYLELSPNGEQAKAVKRSLAQLR